VIQGGIKSGQCGPTALLRPLSGSIIATHAATLTTAFVQKITCQFIVEVDIIFLSHSEQELGRRTRV